ncbi:MAG: mechanosensitive ion channel domain-containing protein [Pseudomonadota bacterium]
MTQLADWRRVEEDTDVAEEMVAEVSGFVTPILEFLQSLYAHVVAVVWSVDGAIEVGSVFLAGALAYFLAKPLRSLLGKFWPAQDVSMSRALLAALQRLATPLIWVGLLWTTIAVLRGLAINTDLVRLVASLLNAWIVIQLFASFVKDRGLAKLFASVAWLLAALNIVGLLGPTLQALDNTTLGFSVGENPLSLLKVIKGVVLAMLLLWLASVASSVIRNNLSRSERLTPSVQTLVAQGARMVLLFGAVMLAMSAIGIDLTALAVFSGAIGVGIGFGLQSIFSNLMAGIILLLEKSVKVGDFIEFDNGLAGEVQEINIRTTLVTTNDNVDILVPNEQFINARVTNWTLREGFRRIRVPFGVAYGTDKELVKKAALEAADSVPHMLDGPRAKPPQVWLTGFGDSSLDFELVVWLRPEAVKRPSAVRADYNWALETALTKYGIEIPFPQRDINIRSGLPNQL